MSMKKILIKFCQHMIHRLQSKSTKKSASKQKTKNVKTEKKKYNSNKAYAKQIYQQLQNHISSTPEYSIQTVVDKLQELTKYTKEHQDTLSKKQTIRIYEKARCIVGHMIYLPKTSYLLSSYNEFTWTGVTMLAYPIKSQADKDYNYLVKELSAMGWEIKPKYLLMKLALAPHTIQDSIMEAIIAICSKHVITSQQSAQALHLKKYKPLKTKMYRYMSSPGSFLNDQLDSLKNDAVCSGGNEVISLNKTTDIGNTDMFSPSGTITGDIINNSALPQFPNIKKAKNMNIQQQIALLKHVQSRY